MVRHLFRGVWVSALDCWVVPKPRISWISLWRQVKAGVADAMRTVLSTQEASRQVASSMPPAQQAVLQSLLPS